MLLVQSLGELFDGFVHLCFLLRRAENLLLSLLFDLLLVVQRYVNHMVLVFIDLFSENEFVESLLGIELWRLVLLLRISALSEAHFLLARNWSPDFIIFHVACEIVLQL